MKNLRPSDFFFDSNGDVYRVGEIKTGYGNILLRLYKNALGIEPWSDDAMQQEDFLNSIDFSK